MSVDAEFAAWLSQQSMNVIATSEAIAAAWGKLAGVRENLSALANKADAEQEAQRQLNLFGMPMAVEILQVAGLRIDLVCKAVRLVAPRVGYATGADVFVLGAKEMDRVERTDLTVLRRLA